MLWQESEGDVMFTVSPSIYSADLLDLRSVLDVSDGFEHIHLDIDDGHFVKGISFGMDMVEKIAAYTRVELDAHLEVYNPMDYVEALCQAGISQISAHFEVLDYPNLFLSKVHSMGKKAGLALNLKTPVSMLEPYVGCFDHLLLVSVEADHEGLIFRSSVLKKISDARKMLGDHVSVWVDGGINDSNLKDVVMAGADGVVIGRAVYQSDDCRKAYDHFLKEGRRFEKERQVL